MTRTLSAFTGLVVLLTAVGVALSLPASAAAKGSKCGQEIVADWFDNGRIDRLYPLHCYEEAIDAIPKDIRDYADAADVINRALQAALNGHLDPGNPHALRGNGRPVDGGNGKDENGQGSQQAAGNIDTSGPSSVPIPLLVLGGISLALLAAGALGYYSRRKHAQADDDSDEHDSPS
ncbi:MAG: hypothetical protein E6G11_08825 [Actinobacteria bacterium]|nr:MAG: hypothetical protein E6G28_01630 [Actinomycetota bacterium]TML47353.1 MAG: hypothetical protein E6G20_08680 [Actinomycetota bacterium]TML69818.1 MAG: hypothetical protein E6G11_08825 [Actinomycetota bacterium]